MPENAKIRDVLKHIRADKSIHRDCNHIFAEIASNVDFEEEILSLFNG